MFGIDLGKLTLSEQGSVIVSLMVIQTLVAAGALGAPHSSAAL